MSAYFLRNVVPQWSLSTIYRGMANFMVIQVLCLIASGQTVSDIAESIHLSVTTISTYRARILDKMSLKNNAELTRYALQHGLVV